MTSRIQNKLNKWWCRAKVLGHHHGGYGFKLTAVHPELIGIITTKLGKTNLNKKRLCSANIISSIRVIKWTLLYTVNSLCVNNESTTSICQFWAWENGWKMSDPTTLNMWNHCCRSHSSSVSPYRVIMAFLFMLLMLLPDYNDLQFTV